MIFLPKNLVHMATLCGTDASRYSLRCVRLREYEGGYRAEASDGRLLGIVRGPDRSDDLAVTDDQRELLEQAPGGSFEAVVPADAWRKAFKQLPAGGVLGASASRAAVHFAAPDGFQATPTEEARFPDVDQVLPRSRPIVRLTVNPAYLAKLLTVAAQYSDPTAPWVELWYYGRDHPLGVLTRNEGGQFFDGLCMPLLRPPTEPIPEGGNAVPEKATAASPDHSSADAEENRPTSRKKRSRYPRLHKAR
jgi:hypothetical protein